MNNETIVNKALERLRYKVAFIEGADASDYDRLGGQWL